MNEVVIYAGSSDYGDYKIVDREYEGRPARVLFAGENAGQSGIALDGNPELLFDYNQRFLEIVESLRPARVLVIGGGAFTLPSTLINRFGEVTVDVVEIDPLLYDLAKKYFEAADDPRMSVFDQDGRAFIDGTKNRYDLIILDAFSGYTIPHPLITLEAAQRYATLLKRGGVFTANFIAAYKSPKVGLTHELLATFGEAFGSVQIFPADHDYWSFGEQNLLLVGASSPPALDYLHSRAVSPLFAPSPVILRDEPLSSTDS